MPGPTLATSTTAAQARLALPARLALEQDVLDVVLHDGIRLVGFAQKAGAVFNLKLRVGDLVPDDRCQVVESQAAAALLNTGVQWEHHMPPELPSRGSTRRQRLRPNAHPARARGALRARRHLARPGTVIVGHGAKLALASWVLLQYPIGRRREDQVNAGFQ